MIFSFVVLFSVHPCYSSGNGPAPQTGSVDDASDIAKAAEIVNQYINRDGERILLDIVKNDRPGKEKALLLLGRLYKEEKRYDRAEQYLLEASTAYPLLGDYALKMLLDVYISEDKHDMVIETASLIKNPLLMQDARKADISSLLVLGRDSKAIETLTAYVKDYPDDWESRLTLATLLNIDGEMNRSIELFKDIYVNSVPLSDNALNQLKLLEADTFTREEILKRADNLFAVHSYGEAEKEYGKLLETAAGEERVSLLKSIAMCRFRTRQYDKSAESFGLIGTPEAMYWQARSYYRSNNLERFSEIKKELEEKFPDDGHIALLLLMEAEEFQRMDKSAEAASDYQEVVKRFPKKAEEALWGLGWMNYVNEDYEAALNYFSQLDMYKKSKNIYKYLFWEAKTRKKISDECVKQKADEPVMTCDGEKTGFFDGLPSDESYYGYLIKLRSALKSHDKVIMSKPVPPDNETAERIEALVFLGLKDEAANEVINALKNPGSREDTLYLGYMAVSLGKYKDIIYHAEPEDGEEFLPYSYPLAYWDIINRAAEPAGVDSYLVAALIREESRFDPDVHSRAGAVGLMQVMPSTAKRISDETGVNAGDGSDHDLYDPERNIRLGTWYLSDLINEFKDLPFAIMSYNAGENIVDKWIEKYYRNDIEEFIENIPYRETRRYVKKVLKSYWQYRTINGLSIPDLQDRG